MPKMPRLPVYGRAGGHPVGEVNVGAVLGDKKEIVEKRDRNK